MILTKNKTLFKNNEKTSLKKRSLIKRSIIGGAILFSAIFSWEVSVTLTNSINISNSIDTSMKYFSDLTNYENFKEKINSIPYTDEEFKRDLKIFGYIFGNNDIPLMKIRYGNYEMRNFLVDRATIKSHNIDEIFKPIIVEANRFKNDSIDYNSYNNKKYSNFFNLTRFNYNVNEKQKLDYRSASIRLNGVLGKAVFIDDKIYENMRHLIKENGFSEDLLYLEKNKNEEYMKALSGIIGHEKSYKNKSDYEKALNKVDYDFTGARKESLEKIKEYYKNGDYEKIREIFKVLNGFSYIIVDDISNKSKFEEYGIRPSLLVEIGLRNIGLIEDEKDEGIESFKKYYMNDAKKVAKLKGTYNEESSKYYDGKEFIIFNY